MPQITDNPFGNPDPGGYPSSGGGGGGGGGGGFSGMPGNSNFFPSAGLSPSTIPDWDPRKRMGAWMGGPSMAPQGRRPSMAFSMGPQAQPMALSGLQPIPNYDPRQPAQMQPIPNWNPNTPNLPLPLQNMMRQPVAVASMGQAAPQPFIPGGGGHFGGPVASPYGPGGAMAPSFQSAGGAAGAAPTPNIWNQQIASGIPAGVYSPYGSQGLLDAITQNYMRQFAPVAGRQRMNAELLNADDPSMAAWAGLSSGLQGQSDLASGLNQDWLQSILQNQKYLQGISGQELSHAEQMDLMRMLQNAQSNSGGGFWGQLAGDIGGGLGTAFGGPLGGLLGKGITGLFSGDTPIDPNYPNGPGR